MRRGERPSRHRGCDAVGAWVVGTCCVGWGVRPFFRRVGSKWRNARRYPEPRHPVTIEPFAGSAGYSVWHEPWRAILNDLDKEVSDTWEYLINASEEEVAALPVLPVGARVSEVEGLSSGARALLRGWASSVGHQDKISKTGVRFDNPGGVQLVGQLNRQGFRPLGSAFGYARQVVSEQLPKIRAWTATSMDYRDLPDIQATWFIDPPYQGPKYRGLYKHEKDIDYRELAEWCRSRRGQVIVCEAEGADWLPFRPMATSNGNGRNPDGTARKTVEVMWTNEEG